MVTGGSGANRLRNLEVGKWSPLGVLKEAATIPRLEETLATRLGQERTPD